KAQPLFSSRTRAGAIPAWCRPQPPQPPTDALPPDPTTGNAPQPSVPTTVDRLRGAVNDAGRGARPDDDEHADARSAPGTHPLAPHKVPPDR
ncbi:hypothetical protein B5P42_31270, partial [Bacillus sp. SRB_331]